jgi:Ca2+-binding RTX toxin-like protein
VRNVDGFNQLNLTNNPANDRAPRFSPDATRIAFASDRDGGDNDIFVMAADGSNPLNLTPGDPGNDRGPEWTGIYRCGGRVATIVGTDSAETLRGTKRADVIVANGGNDKVLGGKGRDRICGGFGKDKLFGGAGNDRLFGQAGKDLLVGGKGTKDRLKGGKGKDKERQ